MSENSVLTTKCPNCGGPLLFEPKDQKFHCQYCQSSFTEAEVTAIAAKQEEAKVKDVESPESVKVADDSEETADVGIFLCPSCGAQIVTEATTASTFCYYCHNPVTISSRLSGKFLPEKILPFQIERKDAETKFLDWVGRKKFVPTAFFDKKQIQNLSGVYFPYWAVNADLTGELSARAQNFRVWEEGDTEYTETSVYQIERAGDTSFKNLVKNALQKNLSDKLVGAVQPFDLSKAIDFKSQYLSGFLTEKRDIEFADMKGEVEQEFHNYATSLMENTISGYATVDSVHANQQITALDEDYVLLPIWLVTYRESGNNKLFYYAMNGQTGKVAGVLPIDKGKLLRAALLIFIILLVLGVIVGYMLS